MPAIQNLFLAPPPLTAARNNFFGCVGNSFTPLRNLIVKSLGRLYVSGNVQDHGIKIYPNGNGVPQPSVVAGTVLAASASDFFGYKYQPVADTLLTAGIRYFLLTDESNGGDTWTDNHDMSGKLSSFVVNNGQCYNDSVQGAYPLVVDPTGTATAAFDTGTFTFTAPAMTWYVASNGSDSNDGLSTSTPFLTLTKAQAVALQDDTILLRTGDTFAESVSFAVGVNIASYGGLPPIGPGASSNGAATIAPSSSTANGLTFTNCDRAAVSNVIITGANTGAPNAGSQTFGPSFPAGVAFKNTQTGAVRYASPTVTNCTISGFQSGVGFSATESATAFASASGFTQPTVTYCKLFNVFDSGIKTSNGTTNQSACFTDLYFAFNDIHDITGNASFNGGFGIFPMQAVGTNPGAANATGIIENNIVHKIGYSASAADNGGPACILTCYCDRITMQKNETWDCVGNSKTQDGLGLDIDLGSTNHVMQYNYAHDNDSCGLYLFDCGIGNHVRWNLSVGNNRQHAFSGEIGSVDGSNVQIYNNSVSSNIANGINISGDRTGFTLNPPLRVLNNAIYVAATVQGALRVDDYTNVAINGNSYYMAGSAVQFRYGTNGASTASGLAAFRSATGLETGTGIESDPKFNNPTFAAYTLGAIGLIATDTHFRLRAGSPLLGTGLDLQGTYGINPGLVDLSGVSIKTPLNIGALPVIAVPRGKPNIGVGVGV